MDKCEHIWLYIGSKRQKVWRCTLCDEYRLEAMEGAYVKAPSGSYTSWENTMCNVLGTMRTQTQNAWHDGYESAKAEREWQGLTDEERNDCLVAADPCECLADPEARQLMEEVENKLRSKNT